MYDEAWDELLHANAALGWQLGAPTYHHETDTWEQYAWDPRERPKVGRRQRKWTTVAPTEERCVRSMAYCLREIAAGRVPR